MRWMATPSAPFMLWTRCVSRILPFWASAVEAKRRTRRARIRALLYRDLAGAVVAHGDAHFHVPVLELLELPLRPFDQFHAGAGEHFRDADLQPLAPVFGEPVAVDVDDRRPAAARILVHDGER